MKITSRRRMSRWRLLFQSGAPAGQSCCRSIEFAPW